MSAGQIWRGRLWLSVFALLALGTAIFGYSGLAAKWKASPTAELEQRCYEVIDKAQLYYNRPADLGGGHKSFIGVTFAKLGLSSDDTGTVWHSPDGEIRLENIQQHQFDLVATSSTGEKLEAINLTYDTRPSHLGIILSTD